MNIKYVRFEKAVQTPGYAGTTITKARIKSDETAQQNRDEAMDEMFIEDGFLVLRAVRVDPKSPRRRIMFTRITPIPNCVDLEPDRGVEVVVEEEPEKKKPTEPKKETKQ